MLWDLLLRQARAKRKSGFTLIELLVVVAIIGLLATFALPRVFEAINKAKGGIGGADLNTISSAMERYYFDLNKYPNEFAANGTTALPVPDALKGEYLKSATTFLNGFGKGYLYFTNANGSYYVLVDAGNNTAAFELKCDTWTATATPSNAVSFTASAAFQVIKTSSAPTSSQMAKGCTVGNPGAATAFDATKAKVVTN